MGTTRICFFLKTGHPENLPMNICLSHLKLFLLITLQYLGYKNIFFKYFEFLVLIICCSFFFILFFLKFEGLPGFCSCPLQTGWRHLCCLSRLLDVDTEVSPSLRVNHGWLNGAVEARDFSNEQFFISFRKHCIYDIFTSPFRITCSPSIHFEHWSLNPTSLPQSYYLTAPVLTHAYPHAPLLPSLFLFPFGIQGLDSNVVATACSWLTLLKVIGRKNMWLQFPMSCYIIYFISLKSSFWKIGY
jgi:hypothetical protein